MFGTIRRGHSIGSCFSAPYPAAADTARSDLPSPLKSPTCRAGYSQRPDLRTGTECQSDARSCGCPVEEVEAALCRCKEQAECDVRLRGESYMSLPMDTISFGEGYVLRFSAAFVVRASRRGGAQTNFPIPPRRSSRTTATAWFCCYGSLHDGGTDRTGLDLTDLNPTRHPRFPGSSGTGKRQRRHHKERAAFGHSCVPSFRGGEESRTSGVGAACSGHSLQARAKNTKLGSQKSL